MKMLMRSFLSPKPSNQQGLPVQSDTADTEQVSGIRLGYWVYIPLTENTKLQSKNFKRVDVFEDFPCILWKHYNDGTAPNYHKAHSSLQ